MARRKITINEALTALKLQGITVKVQAVESPQQLEPVILPPTALQQSQKQVRQHFTKVTLFAKHTIGSSGVQGQDGQIEGAQVISYGPGICSVPVEHASALLYQDQQARQADERMLDKTQRSYIIAQKNGPYGKASVGIRLPDDVDFDGFLGGLSLNNTITL